MKIKNIEDFNRVIINKYNELDDIPSSYLSEVGLAAKEAYRAVIWHTSFHSDIRTLAEDEEFMNLINIPDKHPEYYKIIRKINRVIENIVSEKEGN